MLRLDAQTPKRLNRLNWRQKPIMTAVMTLVMTSIDRGNRAVDRDALRRRIVDAALVEMLAKGYDAARIEDIAARAGVAKGTYYNFFTTKAEVLLERYAQVDAKFHALRLEMQPKDPVKSIHLFVRRAEILLRDAGDLLRVIVENGRRLKPLQDADHKSGQRDQDDMAQFLTDARRFGSLNASANPAQLAATFQLLWTGQTYVWAVSNMNFSMSKSFAPHIDLLFLPFLNTGGKKRD